MSSLSSLSQMKKVTLLSHFWSRWKREYVVELREHHRVLQKGAVSNSPSVEIGDIVTVMEEGKSNGGIWKLGKVLEVCPGNDGLVRGATIEVASSNGRRKRLRRALQKLFPLEVRETSVADGEEPARPIACTSERPRRQAAIEGEMRRRQVDQCLDELKDYDEHWSRGEDVLNFTMFWTLRTLNSPLSS